MSIPNKVMLDKRKERSWRKLHKYLSQITGVDYNEVLKRKMDFMNKYIKRVEYIDTLRDNGYHGKAYSDAMVKYDKEAATA